MDENEFLKKHSKKNKIDTSTIKKRVIPEFKVMKLVKNIAIGIMIVASIIMTITTISFNIFVSQNLELYKSIEQTFNNSGFDKQEYSNILSQLQVDGSGFSLDMLDGHEYYMLLLVSITLVCVLITALLIIGPYIIKKIKNKKG